MCPPRLAPRRGQSAWVKTESGTYSSGMILECDEDSITLETQSGIQVAPLEQCIHVGSIRKGAAASAFAKLLRGAPAPPAHHVQGRSGRIYTGRAFGCLRPTDPLRKWLIDLIEWPPFDAAIMLTILANCTTMALESRVSRPGTPMVLFLSACESAFLWVFTFEFACRAVAMGLLSTRSSYLRDGWCRLDFAVLVLAWLPLFFPSFGNYTAIRALRALRVLRALKWMPSMPALISAIWAAMPRCGQVAVLCVFLFVLTGCTGLHLFAGDLHHRCVIVPTDGLREEAHEHEEPPHTLSSIVFCPPHVDGFCEEPREWLSWEGGANARCKHFDEIGAGITGFENFGWALLTVFKIFTKDVWTGDMYGLMALHSPLVAVYFVFIVIFGGFFIVELFLAVLLQEFLREHEISKMMDVENLLSSSNSRADRDPLKDALRLDRDGESGRESLLPTDHARSDGGLAPRCYWLRSIVLSRWFNHGAMFLVLLNMVVMCAPYASMHADFAQTLELASTVISICFIVEAGLKISVLGWHGYLADRWNILDGVLVSITLVDMALSLTANELGVHLTFLRILRVLRVLRALRIMRAWSGLHRIVRAVIDSLPQMSNVLLLMLLCAITFALVGMQLFGGQLGEPGEPPELRLHFDYFMPAMLTVFVVLSGNWFVAMEEVVRLTSPSMAIYFVTVELLGAHLLMNLFLVVLLELFTLRMSDNDQEQIELRKRQNMQASERAAQQASRSSRTEGANSRTRIGKIRRACQEMVEREEFERAIMFLIACSSIALVLDTPRVLRGSDLALILGWIDKFVTLAFTFECAAKVVAFGFFFSPNAYLKSGWNIVDFVVVLVSILNVIAPSGMSTLRLLRVLRPLRLLAKHAGMRLILESLYESFSSVTNVLFVLLFFLLCFAVVGLQLFMGEFGSCREFPHAQTRGECDALARLHHHHGSSGKPINEATGVWQNPDFGSFDNIGSAMLLLYVVSSGDEWDRIMFRAMDATEIDHVPVRNDSSAASLFFVAWIFVGSFMGVKLFVSVIVESFNRIKAERDGSATMTKERRLISDSCLVLSCHPFLALLLFQPSHTIPPSAVQHPSQGQLQWARTMQTTMHKRAMARPRAQGRFKSIYLLLETRAFAVIFHIVMTINFLALVLYQAPNGIIDRSHAITTYTAVLFLCSLFFAAEAAVKLLALQSHAYWNSAWNIFEFAVTFIPFVGFAGILLGVDPRITDPLIWLPSLLRVLRLARHAVQLRQMIMTLYDCQASKLSACIFVIAIVYWRRVVSLPALTNVLSLLGVLVFIYSILGVQLFTFTQHQTYLNNYRNFDTFGNALLLLFQCLTIDHWSFVMNDCLYHPDHAHDCSSEAGNCGGWWAIPYFVSFQVLGSFVLLNVLVAVILENFTLLGKLDTDLASMEDVEEFTMQWAELDPDASGFISSIDLVDLVRRLRSPMGCAGAPRRWAIKFCMNLDIEQHEGRVEFEDVLKALLNYNYISQYRDQSIAMPALNRATSDMRGILLSLKTVLDNAQINGHSRQARELSQMFAQLIIKDFLERKRLARKAEQDMKNTPGMVAKTYGKYDA